MIFDLIALAALAALTVVPTVIHFVVDGVSVGMAWVVVDRDGKVGKRLGMTLGKGRVHPGVKVTCWPQITCYFGVTYRKPSCLKFNI